MNRTRGELRARRNIRLATKQACCRWRTAPNEWGITISPSTSVAWAPFAPRRPTGSLPRLRALVDIELTSQPVAEIAAIVFAHGVVRDHRRHLGKARFERGAPLGRVEARRFSLAHPQHVSERARGGNHLVDRFAAARAHEIVGIVAFGQARKFQALARLDERQSQIDRTVGGAAAGGIAVEA